MGATDDIISELFLIVFGVVIVAFSVVIISYGATKIIDTLRGVFTTLLKSFMI